MNVIISNKYHSMLQTLSIDVIKVLNGEFPVEEIVSNFQNFYFQRMILDITAIKDYDDIKNLQKLSISLDMDKVILLLDDSPESSSSEYLSDLISMGIYNFTRNVEGIMYLYNNPNSYRDVAHIHQLQPVVPEQVQVNTPGVVPTNKAKIIGVKNITVDAGSTTLIYMMKKQLDTNYSTVAIEVDKRDFVFFKGQDLISTSNSEIGNVVSKYSSSVDVILVDINSSNAAEDLCHAVFYLVEPSTIKLNRMMMISRSILDQLKSKKVVLNKSLLSSKDVLDFEYESKLKIFYNIPPLDDRANDILTINNFLVRLGFDRQQVIAEEEVKKTGILGLFSNKS